MRHIGPRQWEQLLAQHDRRLIKVMNLVSIARGFIVSLLVHAVAGVLVLRPFFETLLALPRIPIQLLGDTAYPVFTPSALGHDICKGISGRRYGDIVSRI